MKWPRIYREHLERRRFEALDDRTRSIVFYAEDAASRTHFEPILRELTQTFKRDVCYLTSAYDDPILREHDPRIHAFCIGKGLICTLTFLALRADVMVMTMPDLDQYHIKRSRVHPVHYAYVFHSPVSTHMIYRPAAFDAFDSILCCGPHHVNEIRARETLLGLEPKRLIEHGYGRLDTIRARLAEVDLVSPHDAGLPAHVLVAPSWGPHGLLETCGIETVETLRQAGFRVTVRPHPMTVRKWPAVVRHIDRRFSGDPAFELETNIASTASLETSDVMISDYSGAAFEYALGYEKPVIFVDLPRKVNNPDYESIPHQPVEVNMRERLGRIVSPDHLSELPEAVRSVTADHAAMRSAIVEARDALIFNPMRSGAAAANDLVRLADERRTQGVPLDDAVPVAG